MIRITERSLAYVDKKKERVQFQLSRMLWMIEFVAVHRMGVTFEDLNVTMKEQFGTCERTTHRDASVLVRAGIVSEDRSGFVSRFKINSMSRLGNLITGRPSRE